MVVTCILVLSLAVDINVVKMAYPGLDCGDDLYSGPITVDSCVVMMTCQGLDCGGLNCILVLSLAVDINVVMMTCPGLDCGGDLYPGPITVDTDVVKMTYTQVWIVVVTCILVLSLAVDTDVVTMTCPGLDCGGDLYSGPIPGCFLHCIKS